MRNHASRRQDPCGISLVGIASFLLTIVAPALAIESVSAADVTPAITALAITPKDRKSYAGDALAMSVAATAADPSALEYQFLMDGKVIQPWNPSASCQQVMTLKELGWHEVTVQVRDPHGQAQQETDIYVLRRPFWPNPDMPPGFALPLSPSAQHE